MNEENRYDDMLNMPHHISAKHIKMSLYNRAAQFSPFAALTGHSDAIAETARLTESKCELDENEIMIINEKLRMLTEGPQKGSEVTVVYYSPDSKKPGGAYLELRGVMDRINAFEKVIVMADSSRIFLEQIVDIRI